MREKQKASHSKEEAIINSSTKVDSCAMWMASNGPHVEEKITKPVLGYSWSKIQL